MFGSSLHAQRDPGGLLPGVFFVFLALLPTPSCVAEPASTGASPPVCLGYDPESRSWGVKSANGVSGEGLCPAGAAFVGTTSPSGRRVPAAFVEIRGYCCFLPAGVLTGSHTFAEDVCPDGAVATGVVRRGADPARLTTPSDPEKMPRYLLRCTSIDTSRFSLGPTVAGQHLVCAEEYVGQLRDSLIGSLYAPESPRVTWAHISAGVRYALGRLSLTEWEVSLCIGSPVGALLTGKRNKYCGGLEFRELRAHTEEVGSDSAVPIFPICSGIDDIFSPNPRCLP